MAEKRYDEALEQVRICLQLHKTQKGTFTSTFVKNAYVIYATVLGRRHDFESLLTVCEEGLQYFPDCSDLLGRRGLALLAANKTEQAIAPLEAALNQHGAIGADRSNVAYSGSVSETLLAIAHWRLGNTDRCDHHLRRTLATAKDHQQAAGRLATFCGLLLGDPKASITLLARIGVRLELASGTPPKSTQ
jgi:tetratricopeptide (TPR) repeat protein